MSYMYVRMICFGPIKMSDLLFKKSLDLKQAVAKMQRNDSDYVGQSNSLNADFTVIYEQRVG